MSGSDERGIAITSASKDESSLGYFDEHTLFPVGVLLGNWLTEEGIASRVL